MKQIIYTHKHRNVLNMQMKVAFVLSEISITAGVCAQSPEIPRCLSGASERESGRHRVQRWLGGKFCLHQATCPLRPSGSPGMWDSRLLVSKDISYLFQTSSYICGYTTRVRNFLKFVHGASTDSYGYDPDPKCMNVQIWPFFLSRVSFSRE